MSSLQQAIETFASKHSVVKSHPFLVGVSGGRDSVALLLALLDCGFSSIVIGHFNHLLRGEESDADEEFVKALAQRFGLKCLVKREAVKDLPGSLETAARNARYHFFSECVVTIESKAVFLAHHADDQVETILFNLFRGGAGLQGMNEQLDRETYSIFRPFLNLRRCEIEEYLESSNQEYRDDSSNFLPIATRNRLRNELLPLICDIMGRDCVPLIQRAAQLDQLKTEILEKSIAWQDFYDPQGRLYLPRLEDSDQWVQLEVIKHYLIAEKVRDTSFNTIQRCRELIVNSRISKVNIPGGRQFCRKSKRLFCV
jgi:tRNA(Ile)-lysidine synthase